MDATNSALTAKRVSIRASSSQLKVLRSAFAKLQVVSSEELKELTEKTGLYVVASLFAISVRHLLLLSTHRSPEKWIHNWYGRERKKTRKTAIVAPDQVDVTKPPSSDAPMSPLEIRDVKIEHRDAILPRSSSFRVIADISTTGESSTSAQELDKPPPKKKARKRNLKKAAVLDVKADCAFSDASLRYTPVGDLVRLPSPEILRTQPSTLQGDISCQREPTSFLHMIPPPMRSPLIQTPFSNQLNALPTASPPRSALAQPESLFLLQTWPHQALQSNAAVIPSPVAVQVSTALRPALVNRRSRKRKLQGEGPTLNCSDFQHYSVDNLSSRSAHQATSRIVNASDSAALNSDSPLTLPEPDAQGTVDKGSSHYRSHTWTSPFPNENPDGALFVAPGRSLHSLDLSLPLKDAMVCFLGIWNDMPLTICFQAIYDFPYRNMHPLPSYPSCSEFRAYVPTPFTLDDVLDPTRAPLKYLTDLLEPFKNENGDYSRLLDGEKRDSVLNTLLDEELEAQDPFRAAMGLVMASKLGLKWEYV